MNDLQRVAADTAEPTLPGRVNRTSRGSCGPVREWLLRPALVAAWSTAFREIDEWVRGDIGD